MTNPFETIDARLSNIESLLLDLKHGSKDVTPSSIALDGLLTVQEAAKFLSLSVTTIYGLVSKAQLPVSKKGKRLYFSQKELSDWIKEGRRKTVSETAKEAQEFIQKRKN